MEVTNSRAMLSLSPLDSISSSRPINEGEKSASGDLTKPTLLIVDDEEGPRQSVKIIFKRDYNVLVANAGEPAIEIARTNQIHVAILDIMMTGMSGVEVLRELKQIDPNTEVIMLTAYETLETARQALRYGACDYLNKPFDIPTMRTAVSKAVEKNRLATGLRSSNEQLQALQDEIQNQKLVTEMAQTKGEIYASVLHDINSPLTVISSFIDILNRSLSSAAKVEGEQLEKFRRDLGKLNSQVTRCVEISRRYLSFLRKGPEKNASASVNQTLQDLEDLLERHPNRNGHQFTVTALSEDAQAAINGTDFLQILLNITINALQCTTQHHEVALTVELCDKPIGAALIGNSECERFLHDETFDNKPPYICVRIRDNGPGIPPQVLSKIFDTTFTTKEAGVGTGLGLSIVKRLLLASHGVLHLQTRQNVGTTFSIYLKPAAQG